MNHTPKIDPEAARAATRFQLAALALVFGLVLLVTAPSILKQHDGATADVSATTQSAPASTQSTPAAAADYFPSHYALHAPETEPAQAPTF